LDIPPPRAGFGRPAAGVAHQQRDAVEAGGGVAMRGVGDGAGAAVAEAPCIRQRALRPRHTAGEADGAARRDHLRRGVDLHAQRLGGGQDKG
jgi:hypothetical protein